MEFNANRGHRQSQPGPGSSSGPSPSPGGLGQSTPGSSAPSASPQEPKTSSSFGKPNNSNKRASFLSLQFASVALLFSATILVVAILIFIAVGQPTKESNFVDSDKYQASFLNGGQVYFGKVTDLNDKHMRLVDIYYLRVNQQVQPAEGEEAAAPDENDISLVKLGCELHGPKDEMLINRDQLVFWENLKEDGQVSQAIAEFKKENPDGQDCENLNQGNLPEQPAPSPDPAGFEEGAPAQEEDN